jgi:hypothetical protein
VAEAGTVTTTTAEVGVKALQQIGRRLLDKVTGLAEVRPAVLVTLAPEKGRSRLGIEHTSVIFHFFFDLFFLFMAM